MKDHKLIKVKLLQTIKNFGGDVFNNVFYSQMKMYYTLNTNK